MREINVSELHHYLEDADHPPLLLDVREPWEFEVCHIEGALLLPMAEIPQRIVELEPSRETVVICHHGIRSQKVALFLNHSGFSQVINLRGGIHAWALEIDLEMVTY